MRPHGLHTSFNNEGRRKIKREIVTMREYYAYRIQHRRNGGQTILCGGRLFQQFIVDAYTAIEEERLRFVCKKQPQLRANFYKNVRDAVVRGDTSRKSLGKRIVLPATFIGGPRYMIQNYQDAMAVCRWAGNPNLFITFTTTRRQLMIMDIQFIEEEMIEDLYKKEMSRLEMLLTCMTYGRAMIAQLLYHI